tara:strand:- start:1755 stop:2462 length:708 start_codon:yes stop_codon:yes gene_type:complete
MYVIFEGGEGTGKSSTMKAVAERLEQNHNYEALLTYHPGSTALGTHIRKLVKYPQLISEDIIMDPLSRQVLYMADTINFIELILKPSLAKNKTVFADRSSFISGLVYATAEEVDQTEIMRLMQIVDPPRADRVYVFICPWEISQKRVNAQSRLSETKGDHYDNESSVFHDKINQIYGNLQCYNQEFAMMISRVAALDNIVHVDASLPQDKVVDFVYNDYLAASAWNPRISTSDIS